MRNIHARSAAFAIESGACRIINIKVGRVGGFTEAKKIHDLCQAQKIPVWCGGMLESGIGRAHNIALSTLENFSLPGDVSASKRYWREDIIDPEVEVSSEGMIKIFDQPGVGEILGRHRGQVAPTLEGATRSRVRHGAGRPGDLGPEPGDGVVGRAHVVGGGSHGRRHGHQFPARCRPSHEICRRSLRP